jgi:signal transduction histidine kinase
LSSTVVRPNDVLRRIESLLPSDHPAVRGQTLIVDRPQDERPFRTDVVLLLRILLNMVVNALEAGAAGDEVRIGTESTAASVTFRVWNRQPIPDNVSPRIFQTFFTTKPGEGRGVGTFSMKLLGETLLKGEVCFETSEEAGTTFRVTLPRDPGLPEEDSVDW